MTYWSDGHLIEDWLLLNVSFLGEEIIVTSFLLPSAKQRLPSKGLLQWKGSCELWVIHIRKSQVGQLKPPGWINQLLNRQILLDSLLQHWLWLAEDGSNQSSTRTPICQLSIYLTPIIFSLFEFFLSLRDLWVSNAEKETFVYELSP